MNLRSLFKMTPQAAPYPPADEYILAASKAYHTLSLLATAYKQDLTRGTLKYRENLVHDLAVKLANKNLESVTLSLLDGAGRVACHQTISFKGGPHQVMDAGTGGQELPVLPPGTVVSHELTVSNVQTGESHYQHHLKWNWTPASERNVLRGADWSTEAHAAITGGRQSGKVHVTGEARQRLIVTRPIGERQYGFACCPALGMEGILLHRRHLTSQATLRFGQEVTAFLVQCPKGIQARLIEVLL